MPLRRSHLACAAALAMPGAARGAGVELAVVSVGPPRHSVSALVGSAISVEFDQPVLPSSVNSDSFWAFGRWSGTAHGTLLLSNGNHTVTLQPDDPFFPGEQVMVILSHDLQAAAGPALRGAGYSWQFWTAARPASRAFGTLDTMTTRTIPQQTSRAYGGIATDLDDDGWADLTIVNEVTADLRVFLNLADGTGHFAPFIQPTFPVNTQASPSEPSDFDRDGRADICVANIDTSSVSILLGNGDGTYAPQQEVTVGVSPRGIAVLDADGDGDTDIVNTNFTSSSMSILLNDGSGVFGAPTFFQGGAAGEWALAAADMNDDGILDLVVSARSSGSIAVSTGDGDGTFTLQTPQAAGGGTWMLNCGDVDGNGTEDVAAVNSAQNNRAILRGAGDGTLLAPQTAPTDPFPLATDLSDLDGDGDLDWVTSSFNGDWRVHVNDGAGGFSFDQELAAPQAASCSLAVDIDGDGDLDLALVDELEDVVILSLNDGTTVTGDLDGDGVVGIVDLFELFGSWGPCDQPCPPICPGDLDMDCTVGIVDLFIIFGSWG